MVVFLVLCSARSWCPYIDGRTLFRTDGPFVSNVQYYTLGKLGHGERVYSHQVKAKKKKKKITRQAKNIKEWTINIKGNFQLRFCSVGMGINDGSGSCYCGWRESEMIYSGLSARRIAPQSARHPSRSMFGRRWSFTVSGLVDQNKMECL